MAMVGDMAERILLCLFSCHEYSYTLAGMKDYFDRPIVDRVQGIRDSWLKDVTGDYKIFKGFGQGRTPPQDEVDLPCLDDYFHSADKLRAMFKYALDKGYDRVFKIDDDCFLWYDRLMQNIPTADYVGSGRGWDVETSKRFPTIFAPGFSVWYSKKAMEILMKSPVGIFAEDRWCGEALYNKGIHLTTDFRYHLCRPTKTNQYISNEELYKPNDWLSVHSMSPQQMVQYHKSLSTVITQQV
jgi:hypothetical protein